MNLLLAGQLQALPDNTSAVWMSVLLQKEKALHAPISHLCYSEKRWKHCF